MSDTTLDSVDDILESTLDDLADLPEFKPFPPGAHRASIHFKVKTVDTIPSVEITLKAIETLELSNPEDTPTKAGDSISILCMLKRRDKEAGTIVRNELGEGMLKEILAPLGEFFKATTPKEIMSAAEGAEVVAVTSLRQDKNDKDKKYTQIKNIQVV